MTGALAWFNGRSLRERRLLLVMIALAAVTIVWGLVILPVRNGLSSTRERYAGAVVRLGEAEAQLAAVKAIQRRAPSSVPAPLADAVRARADGAALPIASLDAEAPGRVRVATGPARAGALLAWIAGLEADGVLVDQLAITPAPPGNVTATMTLRAREA